MSNTTPPPSEGQDPNQMFESLESKDTGAVENKTIQEKAQDTVQRTQETTQKVQKVQRVAQPVISALGNPYTWAVIVVIAIVAAVALQGVSAYQVLGRNPNVCKTAEECKLAACQDASGGAVGTSTDFSGVVAGSAKVKGIKMTEEQTSNAAKIISAGKAHKVPDYGIVIALATAIQEATLSNLNYGDRDSLGLFQQRPSQGWGSQDKINDPYASAEAFYGEAKHTSNPGLLDIKGWEKMPLTVAAQAVQRSGFPGAYAQWEEEAKAIFTTLVGSVPAGVGAGVTPAECSTVAAGGAAGDATGIVKVATEIAWPDGRKVGSGGGRGQSTPAYISYKKKAEKLGGADGYLGGNLFSSCDRFVATVMRNTVDPKYPWGPTATQASYLAGSKKWIQRKGAVQPGDVMITGGSGGSGHTLIILSSTRTAQASYFNYTAQASNEKWPASPSGNYRVSWDNRTYKAYYAAAGTGGAVPEKV